MSSHARPIQCLGEIFFVFLIFVHNGPGTLLKRWWGAATEHRRFRPVPNHTAWCRRHMWIVGEQLSRDRYMKMNTRGRAATSRSQL